MVNPVIDDRYAIFKAKDHAFLKNMFAKYPEIEANFERYLALVQDMRFDEAQQALNFIPRAGSVEWGVSKPKTLGEHTKEVTNYALAYAPDGMDKIKVRIMATLHDLPEAIITDFTPRSELSSEDKHHLERLALQLIAVKPYVKEVIDEFNQKSTPIGQWVNDADKLVMLKEVLQHEAETPELMQKSYYAPEDPRHVGGMFNEYIALHASRIKTEKGKELLADLIQNADTIREAYKNDRGVRVG